MKLTPVAIAEGRRVANTLFNNKPTQRELSKRRHSDFQHAQHVRQSDLPNKKRGTKPRVDIYRSSFRPFKHTLTGRERTYDDETSGRSRRRIGSSGCHMVGADAGEIIQGMAVALNCGATKAQFDATVGIHPTAAEEFVTMRTKVA